MTTGSHAMRRLFGMWIPPIDDKIVWTERRTVARVILMKRITIAVENEELAE